MNTRIDDGQELQPNAPQAGMSCESKADSMAKSANVRSVPEADAKRISMTLLSSQDGVLVLFDLDVVRKSQ